LAAMRLLCCYSSSQAPCPGMASNTPAPVLFSALRVPSDQHGMENIRVDLKQSTEIPVSTTFTQAGGAFQFSGIVNGEYILEVNAQDYIPLQQPVEIKNSGRRDISLLLTRSTNPIRLNLNSGIISAHQLSAPRKAQDKFEKGLNLLYDKSDFRGAITQFQRAINDFPTYYEAYALEGTAYQGLGDTSAAEMALRKSVELSSGKYSEGLFLLSALLSNTRRYQEAVALARKSVAIDAISWQGPFELARALFGLKQYDEAEKSAIQCRDKNPDNPSVYILLANIHIMRRDLPSLAGDLDAYLKIAPTGIDADWVRKIQEQLQAAIKKRERDPSLRDARGKPLPGAENADGANATSPETRHDSGPAQPEPDSSGLPPLRPLSQDNP
jgi:tetratricopeptide (TPR) repeat protein